LVGPAAPAWLTQLLSTDSERLPGAFQFTSGPVKKLEAGKNTLKYLPAAPTVNGALLMSKLNGGRRIYYEKPFLNIVTILGGKLCVKEFAHKSVTASPI